MFLLIRNLVNILSVSFWHTGLCTFVKFNIQLDVNNFQRTLFMWMQPDVKQFLSKYTLTTQITFRLHTSLRNTCASHKNWDVHGQSPVHMLHLHMDIPIAIYPVRSHTKSGSYPRELGDICMGCQVSTGDMYTKSNLKR